MNHQASSSPRGRARATGRRAHPKPGAPPVEKRVRLIFERMAHHRWSASEMVPELVERWGVSATTVEAASAEAGRRIAFLTDVPAVRRRLSAALDDAVDVAAKRPRDLAAVAQVYARIVGAEAPAKVEMSLDGSPQWSALCELVLELLEVAPADRKAEFRSRLETLAGVGAKGATSVEGGG